MSATAQHKAESDAERREAAQYRAALEEILRINRGSVDVLGSRTACALARAESAAIAIAALASAKPCQRVGLRVDCDPACGPQCSVDPNETHKHLWVNEFGPDGASTEVTGMHCAICDATLVKNVGAYGEVWE